MEGKVKWFNRIKGYGFITGDDGEEYFVHYTALNNGTFIRENDRVSFDPANTDKGNQAQNVKLLQKGSELARESGEAEGEPYEESETESEDAEDDFSEDDSADDSDEEPEAGSEDNEEEFDEENKEE